MDRKEEERSEESEKEVCVLCTVFLRIFFLKKGGVLNESVRFKKKNVEVE